MKKEFWHKCWEKNALGFHQEQVHPFLESYLKPRLVNSNKHVFVPLCGKSLDMVWLAEHLSVTGAELSEIACRDFFKEKNIDYQIAEKGEFKVFSFDNIQLLQGDFFKLTKEHLPRVDWVYDRAALIALPAEMQFQYVQHLSQLINAGTRLFLLTLEFPPEELSGPPFSVSPSQVNDLFSGFTVEILASRELKNKQFAQRVFDVSKLTETLYIISRS